MPGGHLRSHHPGHRGLRLPHGHHGGAQLHGEQRIFEHRHLRVYLCLREPLRQHRLCVPAHPDCLQRRQGFRRESLPGGGHRHADDPPGPPERLDRGHGGRAADPERVVRPLRGEPGGLPGQRHPGDHRRVGDVLH